MLSELPELPPPLRRRSLAPGELLFRQGDEVRYFFVLERGRLRLQRHLEDGRVVILQTVIAPQTVAEGSLGADHYHCDGSVEVSAEVAVYERAAVLEALGSRPELAIDLISRMAGQLREARALLELRNIKRASDRVLAYLALAGDGTVFRVERPLKDVAAQIGLSHESLYRTLAALEREGAIERDPTAIRLLSGGD